MKKLLVLDFNNLMYRAIYATPPLTWKGQYTGGVLGFILQVTSQINKHLPDRVIICNDYPPYLRRKDFGQYKRDREGRLDEDMLGAIRDSRKLCEEFIRSLGVLLWEIKGYEADDLIAALTYYSPRQFERIIIVSNDDDLFQLLGNNSVYLQRGNVLYSRKDFEREYAGVELPEGWIKIIAMSGSHNGVPGIKGIGIKTAVRLLLDRKYAEGYKILQKEHKKELSLYEDLIRLPYKWIDIECELNSTMIELVEGIKCNTVRVSDFCRKYGIRVRPQMRDAFSYMEAYGDK